MELTDILNPKDLIDIYRVVYPNTKEQTFFSALHGTFATLITYLVTKQVSIDIRNLKLLPVSYQATWIKTRFQ